MTSLWLEQCLLLALAWSLIWMWRTVRPPVALFVAALVPPAFATLLVASHHWIRSTREGPHENETTFMMVMCVVAVIVPASLMVRHQLVRLIEFVFPRARLVRRR